MTDSEVELLVENGILSPFISSIHPSTILKYLDGKPISKYRNAAFTWILNSKEVSSTNFLLSNVAYMETYIHFESIKSQPTEKIHTMLGSSMYAHNIFLKPLSTHIEMMVRHLRLDTLELSTQALNALAKLADENPNILGVTCVCDYIFSWLKPLYLAMRDSSKPIKLPAPLRTMSTITRHFDYNNLNIAITAYDSMYFVMGKSDIYLAYLLGYDISTMETEYTSRRCLIDQLRKAIQVPSIVTKRCRSYNISSSLHISNVSTLSSSKIDTYADKAINTKDSIYMDDIVTFSPFDVISYTHENSKNIHITRREFDYVLKCGCDPWTKTPIPSHVAEEMRRRRQLAETHFLPAPQPLEILLTELRT